MPCGYAERSIKEFKGEGWVEDYSFHSDIPDQWNKVCDRADRLLASGDWEIVLKLDDEEGARRDSVTYLYKKKTPQKIKWEKEQGYIQ